MSKAEKEGKTFRLALVDVQMPGIDGFELVRRLTERQSPAPPVMMLSSVGWQVNSDHCKDLGISVYLTKPVTTSALFDAITKVLGMPLEEAHPPVAMRSTEPAPSNGLRILVVEDDSISRTLATNILTRNGYSVATARDGSEAVEMFSREPFDLVLMDVSMPNMSGLEAAVSIRKLEQSSNRHTPLVALTAHAMVGDRERCLLAGMDEYITKPIRSKDLLAAISRLTAESLRPAE